MNPLKLIKQIARKFSARDEFVCPKNASAKASIYEFKSKGLDGKEIDFRTYRGKKLLIVNTASKCGYTPQYKELQELHEKYSDRVAVLGFPADNFWHQEPGSNDDIRNFCQRNFGVTFQMFEKSNVVGASRNELYKWLSTPELNGWNSERPQWNFCKYLIDENGELIRFFSYKIRPMSERITALLR